MPSLSKPTTTKKRPAPTQAGPKPKKLQVEKAAAAKTEQSSKKVEPKNAKEAKGKDKGKGKAVVRSRPVTAPKAVEEDEDEEDEDFDEDEDEWVDEDEDEDEGEGEEQEADEGDEDDEDGMNIDAEGDSGLEAANRIKDPNAARDAHKAQKALQEQRKASKPHSSLLAESKRVWSLARQKNLPPTERQAHIARLMDVVRGHVKDVALKHDASRVVQTLVKYGKQSQRDEVAVELKGSYRELAQNKYSKFLVTKLIRFCPTHRASILSEFQSHVLRLLLHREATSVLADAFELYANAYERTLLLRDFYGKETTLFTLTGGSDEDKERAKQGLRGVLEGVDKERRRRVMSAVKENLMSIFNNPEKGAVTHAIVHRALWEYLSAINDIPDDAEKEKLRREIFENCQDILAEMVHTKDGSRVVRELLAEGMAKDRKQILKVLKPHIERMCLDDEAQLVLFTALDVIDDTKLTAKSLVAEMTSSASQLYVSPQGRRSLIYLLTPRTKRHFTPSQIAALCETDDARARTSKKDASARQDEVRRAASEALLAWVEEKGAAAVREPGGSLLIAEVMLYAEGDKSAAARTLLSAISAGYPSPDAAHLHPIDLPHASRMYKLLLQGGHFDRTKGSVERVSSWDSIAFAVALVKAVGQNGVVGVCVKGQRNGTFVVAELCESLVREDADGGVKADERERKEEERKEAREMVASWFTDDVRKDIESGDARGKTVLLEKIAKLSS